MPIATGRASANTINSIPVAALIPGRAGRSPLGPAHSLQLDPDHLAGGRFDAAVLECVRLRIHALEIERDTKLLRIVRTTALGTQLQPLRAGRIGAATGVELARAISR